MAKSITIVEHVMGLHAEPAARFVQAAQQFESRISVANLSEESEQVDAKDVLAVLSLAITDGTTIQIEAEGTDEDEAVAALVHLIERELHGQ
jgi:phosphotransferase system HPr (HPr) family protein